MFGVWSTKSYCFCSSMLSQRHLLDDILLRRAFSV